VASASTSASSSKLTLATASNIWSRLITLVVVAEKYRKLTIFFATFV